MKKIYTIFLLLLTFSIFAQNKVKESSQQGIYFKQTNDGKIEIWNGNPNNNGQGRSQVAAGSYSPTDILFTQDAAGNKYWMLVDGTIVKSEIVSRGTSASTPVTSTPVSQVQAKQPEVKTAEVAKKVETVEAAPVLPAEPVKMVEDKKEEVIVIEEVKAPEVVTPAVESTPEVVAPVEAAAAPEVESVTVEESEVGNVSDLFEKNYEKMNRKEKKLYRKNEKKIMKQLEKELKEGNE